MKPKRIKPKMDEEPKLIAPTPMSDEIKEVKPASNLVTVKVLIGTLSWEKGTFQKGETFTCKREDLAKFGNDVQEIA